MRAIITLLATVLLLFPAWGAIAGEPRVALMPFSVNDNSYRSALAAVELAVLLQAELSRESVQKVEAWRWLNAAVDQNFAPARTELEKLEAEMSRDELAEAKTKGSPVKPAPRNESR